MAYYYENTKEKIHRSMWKMFLEKSERIPEEFIEYYELEDILFDEYEMRPKKKNLSYTLVRMIYEDIDWELFYQRVEETFEEIWKGFGYDKGENLGLDLRKLQFNIVSRMSKRRSFQLIYINMVKLTATSIYKSETKLSYNEKVKVFKDFIEDFNKNSTKLIDKYTNEFKSELLFVKLMLGLNMLTVKEMEEKLIKADSSLGKNITKRRMRAYEEVIKENDKHREKYGEDNYSPIARRVSRITLGEDSEKEQKQFYKSFNKFKNENNITDYRSLLKKLSIIRSR